MTNFVIKYDRGNNMTNRESTHQKFLLSSNLFQVTQIFAGILITGSVLLLSPSLTCGQDTGAAFAATQVDLEPQVAVQPETSTVHINDPGTAGDFSVTINFSVEANVTQVNMFVEATNFYYDDDPSGSIVPPIELVESAGCEIDPGGADAINGNIAAYGGDGDDIDGYPSRKTEILSFNSTSGNYMFSNLVAITPTWNIESWKPAGQYSAKVKLTCIATPP
jgi:hypothetical protein